VGQHAQHGAPVDLPGVDLPAQVPVRPVDDHLVGVGEAAGGGEHRPGVADGHPVPEERSDARDGGGEVDRPEHDHAGAGGVGGDEQRQVVAAALPVAAVAQGTAAAGGEQAAGVVGGGRVQPFDAQRAGGAVGPHDQPPAQPVGVAADAGEHGHRGTGPDRGGHLTEFGEGVAVDPFDEHVDDAAAGQPDGERVVVADPVAPQHRGTGGGDLLGQLVHRAFHAAAGHAAHGRAVRADEHRGAGRAGR
jgi:hypothetical protein